MIKRTTQALCFAAATAFSPNANADFSFDLGLHDKDKLEFAVTNLPEISPPHKRPLFNRVYRDRTYIELNNNLRKMCPSLEFHSVNCSDGSANFLSCSVVSQPFKQSNGTTIEIDLAKYEPAYFSRQEMMAQFLVSSIQSRTESDRLWHKNGRRTISSEEMKMLATRDDNPNKQANMLASSTSLAIQEASFHLGRPCGVSEPVQETKNTPSSTSTSNMLGLSQH